MSRLQELAFFICATLCIVTLIVCVTVYSLDEIEKRTQVEIAKIDGGCDNL